MSSLSTNSTDGDEQWGEVLVACLKAIDEGKAPNRQALLAQYPNFAAELEQFFAEHDYFGRLAAPLRPVIQAAQGAQAPRAFGKASEMECLVARAAKILHLECPAQGALSGAVQTGDPGDGRILRQSDHEQTGSDFCRTSGVDAYGEHQLALHSGNHLIAKGRS